jgi:hypothetical protein
MAGLTDEEVLRATAPKGGLSDEDVLSKGPKGAAPPPPKEPLGATGSFDEGKTDPFSFIKPEEPPCGFGFAQGLTPLLTSPLSKPISEVAGTGTAGINYLMRELFGKGEIADPTAVKEKVATTLSPPPTTPAGKLTQQLLPTTWLAKGWDIPGEKIEHLVGGDPKTSSPLRLAAGQGLHEAWNQLPQFLGEPAGKGIAKTGKALETTAKDLYQQALKPGQKLRRGQAEPIITTLLEDGINITKGGVEKLRGKITALDQKIDGMIKNSSAMVDKEVVASYIKRSVDEFRNDVRGAKSLEKIQKVYDDWMNHPELPKKIEARLEETGILDAQGKPITKEVPASGTNLFPVQKAQAMKEASQRHLAANYGKMKSETIEAIKDITYGLREEVAKAVPKVRALSAEESKKMAALDPLERRVLNSANKNTTGLSLLTTSPAKWAAFMADRSELFKSLVSRMLYQTGKGIEKLGEPIGRESVGRSKDQDVPPINPMTLLGILTTPQADKAKEEQSKKKPLPPYRIEAE